MLLHLSQCGIDSGDVVIRTNDIDVLIVLIVLLSNISKFSDSINILLEVGLATKNTNRFVNVRKISQVCGPLLCEALIVYYAFTGSDYTAAFHKIGKIKPIKTLEKYLEYSKSFRFTWTN